MGRITEDETDEDEIICDPDATIRVGHVYLPYTVPRIKRIFKEDFNVELIWCNCWYKCGRSPFYKRRYRLQDIDTGEMICENLTMDDLRCFLAKNDYPLLDEYSAENAMKPKRSKGAVRFLEAVAEIEADLHK